MPKIRINQKMKYLPASRHKHHCKAGAGWETSSTVSRSMTVSVYACMNAGHMHKSELFLRSSQAATSVPCFEGMTSENSHMVEATVAWRLP